MSKPVDIAFIGFGEAARAFVSSLRPLGIGRVVAYDILIGQAEGKAALEAAAGPLDVVLADTPQQAVAGARLVFSAVTASSSLDAVTPVAGLLDLGQCLIDINSVSAARKQATAALIRQSGAGYVDMAVMAPVHPRGHRTPTLLAGDLEDVQPILAGLDFKFDVAGAEVGQATSIKMIRSLFVKGLEALTVQALTAAKAAGCYDRVEKSLAGSYAGLGWPDFAAYEFERVSTHGIRRAAEMREVAASMAELGFAEGTELATAIADLHQRVGEEGPSSEADAEAHAARLVRLIGPS